MSRALTLFLCSALFLFFICNSVYGSALIIDHNYVVNGAALNMPQEKYQKAKDDLHIAYGHTSHGSQVTSGMSSMVGFINGQGLGLSYPDNFFAWNNGGSGEALDLHDNFVSGDLGNPDRYTWADRTRSYLNDPDNYDVNVIMWSWCGQVSYSSEEDIDTYLGLMNQLELEFPTVTFVYMTGHVDGGNTDSNLFKRNQQIRDYVIENGKVLYDFADIESYDPDGNYYGDKLLTDGCYYDSDGNSTRDSNWATVWQGAHTEGVDWYNMAAAHTEALNGNQKAYAAWALWAEIAEMRAVPVPGAVWLLGSGLICIATVRKVYRSN